MDRGAASSVLREIRTLYTHGTMGGWTDAELLERFLTRAEGEAEDAFATLVARHGPMVLGVCRRTLPASHDVEDAFQATFLVLVRRAASIVRRERLASWLYGVAVRTAREARRRAARERAAERRVMNASQVDSEPPADPDDLLPILDEELNRLPDRYRVALLACELEGQSRHEAAQRLGIPEGTLSTHLARGRKMLRHRLQLRGVSLGVGPIAGLAGPLVETTVPERLIGPTVRAALADSSHAGARIVVSTAVSTLAERVLKMMFLARLTLVVAALLTTAAGTVAAVALGLPTTAGPAPIPDPTRAGLDDRSGGAVGPAGAAAASKSDRYGDPLPDGTVARLGSVRFRAGDRAVKAQRFSADGQTLLTVANEFTLRLWETNTGRLLREVRPGPRSISVHSVTLSPDGKRIALLGSQRTRGDSPWYESIRLLVDATSGREVRRLPLPDRDGDCAQAFTPDGKDLISLDDSGLLRIEDIATGAEVVQRKLAPGGDRPSLTVSPDGKRLAIWSGPNSRKLYLWDWQSGQEPREVELGDRQIGPLAFSPDGQALVACGSLEPFLYEWDPATGHFRKQIVLRDDVTPAGLAFTPDGKTIAVSDSGNRNKHPFSGAVLLVDRGTGKIHREFLTPGVQARDVAISPDGRWLSAAGGVGVHVWNLDSGEEVAASTAGHQGEIGQIAAGHGGLIATASDDQTVRVWDAATGAERRRLSHGHWVRAVALSPDGRFLVSSSLDDFVRLWDISTGNEVYKLPGHGKFGGHRAVGFTPDSQRFLCWGDDLDLRVWDVKTGKVLVEHAVRPPGVPGADGGPAKRERAVMKSMMGPAAFAPDGRRLIAALGGSFHIIETATGRVERSVQHPGGLVISIAVAPDGRSFATSGWGRPIRRNLPDGRLQSSTPAHHPVCLVEVATGRLIRELEMPTSAAGPVAFSTDSKLLAVGFGESSSNSEVRLLDTATQATVTVLANFGSAPHAMSFSTDGKYLVTGLLDGSALVWDLRHVLARKARKEER
jgi:RNA polymerase sigma factor (sigma-70 family)